MMAPDELRDFLEFKTGQYNRPSFIDEDPISIPHLFTRREDIEIAAFMAATLAWGNRKAIVKAGYRLMELMGNSPYEFVMHCGSKDLERLSRFVYRTYNGADAVFFVGALKRLYAQHGGLYAVFVQNWQGGTVYALHTFREMFLNGAVPGLHASKHIANVQKGSSGKRLNMFLRWMVRKDANGVDFGIWNDLGPQNLYLPLDLHTGNVGRKLGILSRKQSDWKAVVEITRALRLMDAADPVKYDFALFGLGIYEKF